MLACIKPLQAIYHSHNTSTGLVHFNIITKSCYNLANNTSTITHSHSVLLQEFYINRRLQPQLDLIEKEVSWFYQYGRLTGVDTYKAHQAFNPD